MFKINDMESGSPEIKLEFIASSDSLIGLKKFSHELFLSETSFWYVRGRFNIPSLVLTSNLEVLRNS